MCVCVLDNVFVSVNCPRVYSAWCFVAASKIMELFINTNTPLLSQVDQILCFSGVFLVWDITLNV